MKILTFTLTVHQLAKLPQLTCKIQASPTQSHHTMETFQYHSLHR